MTQEAYRAAARYWEEKDAHGIGMEPDALHRAMEAYIAANNTCALATGAGDFIRCTPIEYSYHDGCFWMFSEGGKKFVGLEKNPQVCLAIFDRYTGFGSLHGMQVTGRAELVEPLSARYCAHAEYKKIPLAALKKLPAPMHLICVRPDCIEYLCSDFKEQGYSTRQTWVPDR